MSGGILPRTLRNKVLLRLAVIFFLERLAVIFSLERSAIIYSSVRSAVIFSSVRSAIIFSLERSAIVFSSVGLTIIFFSCTGKAQSLPAREIGQEGMEICLKAPPFLVLGGEVGNSSASSLTYMAPVWQKAKAMHFNTVLVPVYWELLEPIEGKFDFTLVDSLIYQARTHKLHLILLWFGSWKNSMSCYAPAWVKKDAQRFPRAGEHLEILSAFEDNNVQADIRAFTALMQHVKKVDANRRTVIMVQVENEIGMLGAPREYTPVANRAYAAPVPDALMQYLASHKDSLVPELRQHWSQEGYKTAGNWETVFGKSIATEELFQAWYYAVYTNKVATAGKAAYSGNTNPGAITDRKASSIKPNKVAIAGKAAYSENANQGANTDREVSSMKPNKVGIAGKAAYSGNTNQGANTDREASSMKPIPRIHPLKTINPIHSLPFFVNAALNYRHVQPGAYPSGGPLPHLMDIWQAGAPAIDILSPDFYNPFFKEYNDLYTRQHNPLFIPEIRFEPSDAVKVLYAVGHYKAMGFSPFSFESTDHPDQEPLGKSYALLAQLSPFLYKYPMEGILPDSSIPQEIHLGKYTFTVAHEATLGWTSFKDWPLSGGIIIQTGEDDFIIAGTGIVLTVKNAGILQAEEGAFNKDGKWLPGRRLNGDQTHQGRHIRIASHNWEIQQVSFYQSL